MRSRTAAVLRVLAVILGLAACALSCAKDEPPLIPREVLFGNPVRTAPTVSPDATKIAYVAPLRGVLNVWVKSRNADDDRPVTNDADRGIMKYFWALDGAHILYLQDAKGIDNWRLCGVDLRTGATKDFTPFDSIQAGVVAYNKRFPNELIVAMNRDDRELSDAYRLNLDTGELVLVAKNPGNVGKWIADGDFRVRAALALSPDGGYDLLARRDEKAPWMTLCSWDYEESASSGAIRFTGDGESIFCRDARDFNTGRLVKISLADSSVTVVTEDPRYEIVSLFMHVDTYEMQAVAFARSRIEWMILDDAIRADFEAVARLAEGDFEFTSTDAADSTWVLGFTRDNGPTSYYIYERKTKKGELLFTHMSALERYTLARMEPVTITARDGLELHGYITYPPGSKRRNLPLVLRVHGGPWTRDYWGYNPEAQWLANRGYVCLQVDFRGSWGYGKKFSNAGDRQWGAAMQDDLTDAVRWAIGEGIADPKKIAIMGASYGGYAALTGLATTPDLYACGIDVSGPSNLREWVASQSIRWGLAVSALYRRVGHPETNADLLKARSPLFKANLIKAPLLVVQGGKDRLVPRTDAESIVAALKKNGVSCEYLLFPDEGGAIGKAHNRLKFYETAECFLARYLGGRCEEAVVR